MEDQDRPERSGHPTQTDRQNDTRLAAEAVAVIVAHHVLAAGKEREGSSPDSPDRSGDDATGAVYELVRSALAENADGLNALERLQEGPTDERRRAALAEVLASRQRDDSAFAAELARLVREATANTGVTQTIMTIYGYDQAQAIGIL